jgi:sugar-specific transcriptional regulator TrmB
MDSIIIFSIGFILGVVAVAIAIEIGVKKTPKGESPVRFTETWDISEFINPRIIAEHYIDVTPSKRSRVLVNQYKDPSFFKDAEVKRDYKVKGNIILDDDRALILAGPMKRNEIGVWTVDKEVLKRLNAYFNELWSTAETLDLDKK